MLLLFWSVLLLLFVLLLLVSLVVIRLLVVLLVMLFLCLGSLMLVGDAYGHGDIDKSKIFLTIPGSLKIHQP